MNSALKLFIFNNLRQKEAIIKLPKNVFFADR